MLFSTLWMLTQKKARRDPAEQGWPHSIHDVFSSLRRLVERVRRILEFLPEKVEDSISVYAFRWSFAHHSRTQAFAHPCSCLPLACAGRWPHESGKSPREL